VRRLSCTIAGAVTLMINCWGGGGFLGNCACYVYPPTGGAGHEAAFTADMGEIHQAHTPRQHTNHPAVCCPLGRARVSQTLAAKPSHSTAVANQASRGRLLCSDILWRPPPFGSPLNPALKSSPTRPGLFARFQLERKSHFLYQWRAGSEQRTETAIDRRGRPIE